jgi:ubiquinone biosynthesis protein COQ9
MSSTRAEQEQLLEAALRYVHHFGWTRRALLMGAADAELPPAQAHRLFPRGGIDLLCAFHRRGDAQMLRRLRRDRRQTLRVRDRVTRAVRYRIEASGDRALVNSALAVLLTPRYAAQGRALLWGTADSVWTGLGDASDDFNWYSKRAILSAVYLATLLYWLADSSEEDAATWRFLDQRIDGVMQIEKLKSAVNRRPLLRAATVVPRWLLGRVRAPVVFPETR